MARPSEQEYSTFQLDVQYRRFSQNFQENAPTISDADAARRIGDC